MDLKDKRLLILGGANQHVKLVEAAKSKGFYTIVADYLEQSPAKLICDEPWLINIYDIPKLAERCMNEGVNGVVAGFLDPCQIPYFKLCSELSLPCYGTERQFFNFTNKKAFKRMCIENQVGAIKDYSLQDVLSSSVDYPVYVKPVDSRGSRGQSICKSKDEVLEAVKDAKDQSSDGDFIIEQYMGDCDELQVTYFVINGKAYLERTVDSFRGSKQYGLDKVVICSVSPSRFTDCYLEKAHHRVVKMIENMGIKNGPVFMQGFHKNGEFHFFDPGLRFPGVEYEQMVKRLTGIDFMSMMVDYAVTSNFDGVNLPDDIYRLNGNYGAILFPVLRDGKIADIQGVDKFLSENEKVVSYNTRYSKGDTVGWSSDVNQRFAEIDFWGESIREVAECISDFQNTVRILDENGQNMLFDEFDATMLNDLYN